MSEIYPLDHFCLYPIDRVSRPVLRGGIDDDDFESLSLPFDIGEGVSIEDVSTRIPPDEFDIFRNHLGKTQFESLEHIKYAIVHRYPRMRRNVETGELEFEAELRAKSHNLVRGMAACLRLIRPTSQRTQLFWGEIDGQGNFCRMGFDNPMDSVYLPMNQRLFSVRREDIEALAFYAPRFNEAMNGDYWKFRMAVIMHETGHFQNLEWKVRYFMWTAALESLYTSHHGEHMGSLVAKERIKFILGASTLAYPPGELDSLTQPPTLTIADVVDELYCLRNNIAHGDRVPAYYGEPTGRLDFNHSHLSKGDTLLEIISFVVRRSLLTILKDGLTEYFRDAASSESFFTAQGLTKKPLQAANPIVCICPE